MIQPRPKAPQAPQEFKDKHTGWCRGEQQQQVKRSSGVKWEAAQRHGQINKRGQQGSRTEARQMGGCEERSEKGKQGWHGRMETTIKHR